MEYISRAQWGARPARWRVFTRLASLLTLDRGMAVHYTAGASPPYHTQCYSIVRGIQNYHMDGHGWSDIAYNWLVCNHGGIFEGRGWGVKSAAQGTFFGNTNYEAVCWLGLNTTPTEEALLAMAVVIEHAQNVRGDGKRIRTHGSFKSTVCPGPWLTTYVNDGRMSELMELIAFLRDLKSHVDAVGSNPSFVRYTVEHLRNHPSPSSEDNVARANAAQALAGLEALATKVNRAGQELV